MVVGAAIGSGLPFLGSSARWQRRGLAGAARSAIERARVRRHGGAAAAAAAAPGAVPGQPRDRRHSLLARRRPASSTPLPRCGSACARRWRRAAAAAAAAARARAAQRARGRHQCSVLEAGDALVVDPSSAGFGHDTAVFLARVAERRAAAEAGAAAAAAAEGGGSGGAAGGSEAAGEEQQLPIFERVYLLPTCPRTHSLYPLPSKNELLTPFPRPQKPSACIERPRHPARRPPRGLPKAPQARP